MAISLPACLALLAIVVSTQPTTQPLQVVRSYDAERDQTSIAGPACPIITPKGYAVTMVIRTAFQGSEPAESVRSFELLLIQVPTGKPISDPSVKAELLGLGVSPVNVDALTFTENGKRFFAISLTRQHLATMAASKVPFAVRMSGAELAVSSSQLLGPAEMLAATVSTP